MTCVPISVALLLALSGAAAAQTCPQGEPSTQCDGDEDCDGIPDDDDPCPTQCDHTQCPQEAPMECDDQNGCAAGLSCTESGRCAAADAACPDTQRRYTGGDCVPAADLDGVPNSCQKRARVSSWRDPGYCRRYRTGIGFLGLFVTPYAIGYVHDETDNELTAGIEVYAAGRLGAYRYLRGTTIPPKWSYYLAAFGSDYFEDDGHVGGRVGLKRRIEAWPGFLGFLTDVVTRWGVSGQYLYGEIQRDGDRSHLPGLLLELEALGVISVGTFGQVDVNHDNDLGIGGLIRFDLSDLKELGVLD